MPTDRKCAAHRYEKNRYSNEIQKYSKDRVSTGMPIIMGSERNIYKRKSKALKQRALSFGAKPVNSDKLTRP